MPISNTTNEIAASSAIAPLAAPPTVDQELENWDAYYQLLLAGQLRPYAGEFIVIRAGSVVGHGADSDELRVKVSQQLGLAPDRLVVPFVDDNECICAE